MFFYIKCKNEINIPNVSQNDMQILALHIRIHWSFQYFTESLLYMQ